MPEVSISGLRVLVVEDEYFLADDLKRKLTGEGVVVVGPAANVEDALRLIGSEARLDAALLDVNLGGDRVYPVAERLEALGVPFLLATGYNERDLPTRWRGVPRLDKGSDDHALVARISRLVSEARGAGLSRA